MIKGFFLPLILFQFLSPIIAIEYDLFQKFSIPIQMFVVDVTDDGLTLVVG